MKLDFITLDNLKPSPLNVRKHGETNGDDLIPSIKALGVVQPLLVRPNCEGYDIVAGQRRYHACTEIAKTDSIDPLPCLIMEDGDDATAIEASLAENIERLPMDELDQYEAFRALTKAGRSVEDIAVHFGVTERLVQQRLALANLYPPILNAYRRDDIRPGDLKNLTMATKAQQRAWWKLVKSEEDYAPTGRGLRDWLFGGDEIPTSNALFDLDSYPGAIISSLFDEDAYFGDSSVFWEHQSKEISTRIEAYREAGWADVVLHDVGTYWPKWDYVRVAKKEGGAVHIVCASNGEVTFHEGYLDQKAYKRAQKAAEAGQEGTVPPTRPELTTRMQDYLAAHRHAAVRMALMADPALALRFVAAEQMVSLSLSGPDSPGEALSDSLAHNSAAVAFEAEKAAIYALLDMQDGDRAEFYPLFVKMQSLSDDQITRVMAFIAAHTLSCNSATVELLGTQLKTDMTQHWQPDDLFFDLWRDKEAINAGVKDCAGKNAAEANVTGTAKVQKNIIKACLSGERKGKQDWHPRYMAFPMRAYTKRGGIRAMDQAKRIKRWVVKAP